MCIKETGYSYNEGCSVRICEYDDNNNCIKLKESIYDEDYSCEVTFEYTSVKVSPEKADKIRIQQNSLLHLYS